MSFSLLIRHSSRRCIRFFKQLRYFSANHGKITSSYYHEKGTISFVQSTIGDLVDEAADECGDNIGFSLPFQNIAKTFTQFKNETDQLAAGLVSLGLTIGDRIAIYGPNSYEWVLAQYGAAKAGLTIVCINPACTEKELEYALQKVTCRAIVFPESFKKRDYYKTLCEVIPEIPKSQPGQIKSQRLSHLQSVITMSEKVFPGAYRLRDLMKADGSDARRLLIDTRKKIQFDNAAVILFTSGTTGFPKAATLSHFQLVNQTKSFICRARFDIEKPVICLQVPLFHAFGCIGGPPITLLSKGKCVFPSEHFDPALSLKAIEEEKCTVVYGVPTMFHELMLHLRNKEYNLQSWKKVLVGASPVPLELLKILQEKFGVIVSNGYGATETCGVLSAQSSLEPDKYFGSTGKPIGSVEVKIVDKQGHVVPVNTNGEVLTRSPFVFTGYWGDTEKTKEVFDSNRWYHTGDIGSMNEEGYIYITGRIKDMVIRGGENIYPTEVENFLMTHPAISDVYVVGVPDQKFGEELCASIKLKPGCTITEDELKEFCKDKISYFKVPRYVLFYEEFPKTGSGKVIKHILKEECTKRLKL